jgi:hypothetical protein
MTLPEMIRERLEAMGPITDDMRVRASAGPACVAQEAEG